MGFYKKAGPNCGKCGQKTQYFSLQYMCQVSRKIDSDIRIEERRNEYIYTLLYTHRILCCFHINIISCSFVYSNFLSVGTYIVIICI